MTRVVNHFWRYFELICIFGQFRPMAWCEWVVSLLPIAHGRLKEPHKKAEMVYLYHHTISLASPSKNTRNGMEPICYHRPCGKGKPCHWLGDNIKVIDGENKDQVRRIRESIYIRKEQHPMNRDEGAPSESSLRHHPCHIDTLRKGEKMLLRRCLTDIKTSS